MTKPVNTVAALATPKKTESKTTAPSTRVSADTTPGILTTFHKEKETKAVAEVTVDKTAQTNALQQLVAAQLTDRRFAPVDSSSLTKPVTYVTASNGLFKMVKTAAAIFTVKLTEMEGNIPGLPAMEEGVELLVPKIPFRKLVEALSWYRDVNERDKTEVSTLFFWNHRDVALPNIPGLSAEGRLVTYCPVQVNSAVLSDFSDDKQVDWMRQNLGLLLEVHSHNSMDAFFSGTDNANENMNQFYAVWGRVEKDEPAFIFRWVCGDRKVVCSPEMLIEWPKVTYREVVTSRKEASLQLHGDIELVDVEGSHVSRVEEQEPAILERTELVKGPFKRVAYPADWMAQHSLQRFGRASYNYGGYTSPYRATGSGGNQAIEDNIRAWEDYYAGGGFPDYADDLYSYEELEAWAEQGTLLEERSSPKTGRAAGAAPIQNRKVSRSGGLNPKVNTRRSASSRKGRGK